MQAPASTSITNGIELGDAFSSRFWHGDIAEVIGFGGFEEPQERNRIESYLALKYGVTLNQSSPQNYVASDGNTYWNGTTNSAYNSAIAGIGRDDDSGLEQKQSRSALSGAILTMGNVAIANSNLLNSNTTINDLEWLVWGQDGGSTASFTTTDDDGLGTNNDDDTPLTVTQHAE